MKRIICLIISLCLILGSFSFVFAEAWTTTDVYYVRTNVADLLNATQNIYRVVNYALTYMVSDINSPNSSILNMYGMLQLIATEMADYVTGWQPMVTSIFQTESNTSSIINTTSSIVSNTNLSNNKLEDLRQALTNYAYETGFTGLAPNNNAHANFVNSNWMYSVAKVNGSGIVGNSSYNWVQGTPLGNIAYILESFNRNFVNAYNYEWLASLTHYNDNLTTWDSQGNTLTQVAFTPESAIQGLYRYLAFTQRDVARLAYAYASDEELEAREQAKANQEQIFDDFIDPSGDGSVSTTDIGDMAGISSGIKDNLDTGVSAGGIFDVFTGNHSDEWFSQTTYNELMGIRSTRDIKSSGTDYSTPLLDQQMNDLLSLFGGDVVD